VRIIKIKFEFVLPFFLGVLVAMNFCAFIALSGGVLTPPPPPAPAAALPEEAPPFIFSIEGLSPAFLLEREEAGDVVFDSYREPASRNLVIDFFTLVCGSHDIAEAVLSNAEAFNVSPSLAFALCWEESRYKPNAVNRRNLNGSKDRGLFQLNNYSFPDLTDADFFNPRVNAMYGMGHLRWCLDTGGSEIAALAMYNAGTGRVSSGGTPKHTLDYIARILASRQKIDALFRAEIARVMESPYALELGLVPASEFSPEAPPVDIGAGAELADAPVERSRFALLSPLSGM
jgi:hypothetical protein